MTVKQDIKMFLDNLSVRDKVEVLKELYKDIAGLGVEGDTQLAHINTFEANLLVKCGGSGTLHPVTGLPQYKGGGGGTPQAVFQSTNQASRLPEEVAPFAEDVLTEAQDYYRMIMNQGYDPYTGAVIAPQTAEQEEAQAGLAALGRGGQGTALQQEALDLQRQQAQKFTPEVAQEYMSPYQRAVTDIEKRQAVEDFQRNVMPQFEAQAVGAGGMSGLGTRAGVQAGILGENLQRRLGDIEAKGLQSAFLNAQQQFQNQKQREAAQAQNIANLGPAMFSQGLAQQGALQSVGEQRQRLGQQALDEQYFKFLEQKAFPEEQLAKYAGFVYGNPLLSQRDVSTTASAPGAQAPSTGQQLLGTGLAAASAFKQMAPQTFNTFTTGVGNALANTFTNRKGGGGLSDVIYRQESGQTSPDDEPDNLRGQGLRLGLFPEGSAEKMQEEAAKRRELERLQMQTPSSLGSLIQRLGSGVFGTQEGLDKARDMQAKAQAILQNKIKNKEEGTKPAELEKGLTMEQMDKAGYPKFDSVAMGKDSLADEPLSGEIEIPKEELTAKDLQRSAIERAQIKLAQKTERALKQQAEQEAEFPFDLETKKGIEAASKENMRILNAAADMNKAIRTNARGEIDRTGMMLQALANSLLKSIPGDPRDPASTRGTFLLRIADGLKDGSISINEAEAEMRKLERADAEAEIKDREKVTKVKLGETKLLGELPAKLRALAVAKAKRAGITAKQLSDIAKNNADVFKTYTDGLANLEKEGALGEFSKGIITRAAVAAASSRKNPEAGKLIADELENLDTDVKKEFTMAAHQKLISAAAAGQTLTLDQAIIRTIRDFNNAGRLGRRSVAGITTTAGRPIK